MLKWPLLSVPAFLLAQMLFVKWATGNERRPAPPDPAVLPAQLDGWKRFSDQPVTADVASELGADRYVNRDYAQASSGAAANLFLAWYASQRGGEKQPHSPKVCLPAGGWIPSEAVDVTLDTAAGPIRVNRYVVQSGAAHGVMLYWYQTSNRVIAGEWSAKLWLVADALRNKRTDVALVRIFAQASGNGDTAAMAAASSLAQSLYPSLRGFLPQ
jgi:EpsI family protein